MHRNLSQLLLPLAGCLRGLLLLPLRQQLSGTPAGRRAGTK
jgi:hypothetical protein